MRGIKPFGTLRGRLDIRTRPTGTEKGAPRCEQMQNSIIVLVPQHDGLSPILLDEATVKGMDVFFCTELGRCFKPALSLYPPRAGMIQVPKACGLRGLYLQLYPPQAG
jgi:hypothetical protein